MLPKMMNFIRSETNSKSVWSQAQRMQALELALLTNRMIYSDATFLSHALMSWSLFCKESHVMYHPPAVNRQTQAERLTSKYDRLLSPHVLLEVPLFF